MCIFFVRTYECNNFNTKNILRFVSIIYIYFYNYAMTTSNVVDQLLLSLQDTLIEKLRLKNSTLKVQKRKLHMQLKQVTVNSLNFLQICTGHGKSEKS